MTDATLEVARWEARQFLKLADRLVVRLRAEPDMLSGCRESGAVRRASMDLTRALAELRKP